jgi:hypothetical protein
LRRIFRVPIEYGNNRIKDEAVELKVQINTRRKQLCTKK